MIFKQYEPSSIFVHFLLLCVAPALSAMVIAASLSAIHAAALSYLVFYASLVSSIVLYRLSPVHPLYHYPGPICLKISKLWLAWAAAQGNQHIYIAKLHEQYGDVIRIGSSRPTCLLMTTAERQTIGPNEVSFSDTSVIDPLMGSSGLPKP